MSFYPVQSDTGSVVQIDSVSSSTADVFASSLTYQSLYPNWDIVHALMGGTGELRRRGQSFLPKEPAETQEDYQLRLSRSVLVNYYAKAVDTCTNKVFSKPMMFRKTPDIFNDWLEDIDMQGRHVHVFARDVFRSGVIDGISYILVDAPTAPTLMPSNRPRTKEDDLQLNIRPYMTAVPARNIIGWRSELINSREVLKQVRIREDRMVPYGEFGEKLQHRVRVLFPGGWKLYGRDVNNGAVTLLESGTTELDYIPLVPFYTNRTGFMTATPPLMNLAWVQLRHFQSMSDQINILKVARLPMLHIASSDNPDEDEAALDVVLGANHTFKTGPDDKISWVEHTGKAIDSGRQDLLDLKDQLDELSYNLTKKHISGDITATENSLDAAQAHAALQSFALNFQDAMEQALAMLAEMGGVYDKTEGGGSVLINKEYGQNLTASDFPMILQMRLNGDITKQTELAEAKRRGLFSEDFDIDAEIVATKDIAPLAGVVNTSLRAAPGTGNPGE